MKNINCMVGFLLLGIALSAKSEDGLFRHFTMDDTLYDSVSNRWASFIVTSVTGVVFHEGVSGKAATDIQLYVESPHAVIPAGDLSYITVSFWFKLADPLPELPNLDTIRIFGFSFPEVPNQNGNRGLAVIGLVYAQGGATYELRNLSDVQPRELLMHGDGPWGTDFIRGEQTMTRYRLDPGKWYQAVTEIQPTKICRIQVMSQNGGKVAEFATLLEEFRACFPESTFQFGFGHFLSIDEIKIWKTARSILGSFGATSNGSEVSFVLQTAESVTGPWYDLLELPVQPFGDRFLRFGIRRTSSD